MSNHPKNRRSLIGFFTVAVILLAIINISLSATLADAGSRIIDLNRQQQNLQTEILALDRQTLNHLALTDLLSEASKLGYTTSVSYLELPSRPAPLAYIMPAGL